MNLEYRNYKKRKSMKNVIKLRYVLIIMIFIFAVNYMVQRYFNKSVFSNDESLYQVKKYNINFLGMIKVEEESDKIGKNQNMGGIEYNINDNNQDLRFFFYKIKQGESIYTISKKLGLSMDSIISLNSLDDAHSLDVGQKLMVPSLDGIIYTVKEGDTLSNIAVKYKINVEDILDRNDISEDGIVKAGDVLFLPGASLTEAERAKALGYIFNKPVRGRFTSGFGIRRDPFTGQRGYHTGIDVAAPTGTPVFASKEGKVVYSGWKSGYGLCVMIKHQFGYQTVYAHLSSINVSENKWVKTGQFIGRVGNTGRSTGPHLHFEVRKYDKPINPLRLQGLKLGKSIWY